MVRFGVPDSPSALQQATESSSCENENSLSSRRYKKRGSLQDGQSFRPKPIEVAAIKKASKRPPSSRGAAEDCGPHDPLWSPPMTREEGEQLDGMKDPEDPARSLCWSGRTGMLSAKVLPESHSLTFEGAEFLRYRLTHRHLVNLVHIRGFAGSDFEDDKPKRLLWEYCDKRNLTEVIKKRRHGVEESLIWHVLCSLLKAAMYLHQGVRGRSNHDDTDDFQHPIIHNAINPDNIFFKGQDLNTNYPQTKPFGVYHRGNTIWPLVKLGNFSKARILQDQWYVTTSEDFPVVGRDQITYFEPPECTWGYRFRPNQGKGDIWSIAACAVAMMAGLDPDARPKDPSWKKLPAMEIFYLSTQQRSRQRSWTGWDATELNHNYSELLRDFLESLLVINPTRRPDAVTAFDECTERWRQWKRHLIQTVDNIEPFNIASSKIPIPPLTEAELPTLQLPFPDSDDAIQHFEKQPNAQPNPVSRKRKGKASDYDPEAEKREKSLSKEGRRHAIDISSGDESPSSSSDDDLPRGNPLLTRIRAERAERIGIGVNGLRRLSDQEEKDKRTDSLLGPGRAAHFRRQAELQRREEEDRREAEAAGESDEPRNCGREATAND